jgi:hypothetical protein
MVASEDDTGMLRTACYAAYEEAIRAAYRTLSSSIAEYFDENPEIFHAEILSVPRTFRPLKEYEKALKIQQLALRLALRVANNLTNNAEPQVHVIAQSGQFLPSVI